MNFKFQKTRSAESFVPQSSTPAGESPGTVAYVGKKRREKVRIKMMHYTEGDCEEKELAGPKEALPYKDRSGITWVNISGVHETKIIEEAGAGYDLHPLTLEDITNTTQRPKIEEYDHYLYFVLKMAYYDEEQKSAAIEQVSVVLGKGFVLTFQEREADILEPLRNRIRFAKGKIRRMGSDYLAYAIADAIIDHYFSVVEQIGEDIGESESRLINNPKPATLNEIYKLKKELLFLRRAIWPMREVLNNLQHNDYALIEDTTVLFIRDAYDHTVQVAETIETFRDMVSGMLDLYMSTVSNKLNEVMKVLTIFSSIFIPLTFLVGVYGMNFDYMPELRWQGGYFFLWGAMIIVAAGLLLYFKRKKWF